MALDPKDVPVTRQMVYEWLMDWEAEDPETRPAIQDYIVAKVNGLDLHDAMVNTVNHEDLDDQTSLVEMILADLPSYGVPLH